MQKSENEFMNDLHRNMLCLCFNEYGS